MKIKKKGFTLIELIIAMTIFFIMSTLTYVNYSYYQNITQVKVSLKDISQSINDAKNMAINGYDKGGINQSIGLYLSGGSNELYYYAYNFSGAVLDLNTSKIVKTKKLQNNVFIKDISGKNNAMIYFNSIYGNPELYYFNGGPDSTFYTGSIKINISFKDAVNPPLKRILEYTKSTNRIDY